MIPGGIHQRQSPPNHAPATPDPGMPEVTRGPIGVWNNSCHLAGGTLGGTIPLAFHAHFCGNVPLLARRERSEKTTKEEEGPKAK